MKIALESHWGMNKHGFESFALIHIGHIKMKFEQTEGENPFKMDVNDLRIGILNFFLVIKF